MGQTRASDQQNKRKSDITWIFSIFTALTFSISTILSCYLFFKAKALDGSDCVATGKKNKRPHLVLLHLHRRRFSNEHHMLLCFCNPNSSATQIHQDQGVATTGKKT